MAFRKASSSQSTRMRRRGLGWRTAEAVEALWRSGLDTSPTGFYARGQARLKRDLAWHGPSVGPSRCSEPLPAGQAGNNLAPGTVLTAKTSPPSPAAGEREGAQVIFGSGAAKRAEFERLALEHLDALYAAALRYTKNER